MRVVNAAYDMLYIVLFALYVLCVVCVLFVVCCAYHGMLYVLCGVLHA